MVVDSTFLFWIFFPLTLAALVATVITGVRHRRRPHLILAPASVVLLAITIVFAERMGAERTFPPEEMAIHLWFAKAATLLVLLVAGSGVCYLRTPRARWPHRIAVGLFLVAAVIASATGVWVFGLSTPK